MVKIFSDRTGVHPVRNSKGYDPNKVKNDQGHHAPKTKQSPKKSTTTRKKGELTPAQKARIVQLQKQLKKAEQEEEQARKDWHEQAKKRNAKETTVMAYRSYYYSKKQAASDIQHRIDKIRVYGTENPR
jgi:hypothetical protein